MVHRKHWIAAMIVAAAGASAAQADTVIATFNGVGPGEGVNYSLNFGGSFTGTSAGRFNWTRTGGTAAEPTGNYVAFCIELQQNVSNGGNYTYDVTAVALAPVPASPFAPMGAARADALARLWNAYYTNSGIDNTNAAAFQLCVWEIVFNDTMSFDLGTGQFQATGNATTIALANAWLVTAMDSNAPMASIYALTSETNQDMLVPTPGAAALAGLGTLAAMRRKR
ncbi:MAG: hypothetical protein KIT68_10395 [Phycisphaeraceae bacterium]|nr:hypothetical protein [Phycisphaeraceae bacterium]